MRKKVIFILVLIFLILVAGGVFLWQLIPEEPEIKGSPEDYQVIEKEDGKWIENKKAGLKVKVPDGWIVEKIDVMEGSMIMYSPDAEGMRPSGRVRPPLKKGCLLEIAVVYKDMNFDDIRKEVEEIHEGLIIEFDSFETTIIKDMEGLRNKFESKDLGYGDVVYIPYRNKLYSFAMYAKDPGHEKCSQELDSFLQTVSIE